MVNMPTKFDEDVHNYLMFIMFTRLKCDEHIHWRNHRIYYIPLQLALGEKTSNIMSLELWCKFGDIIKHKGHI